MDDTQARTTAAAETGESGGTDDFVDEITAQVEEAEEIDELKEAIQGFLPTLIRLDDNVTFLQDRVTKLESAVTAAEEERADLREQADVQDRLLKSFIGPAGKQSSREKRLMDIKAAMIRTARGTDRAGVKKDRLDVEETLLENGYGEEDVPSLQMLNTDIDDLGAEPGFEKTTKERTYENGQTKTNQAIKLDRENLPVAEEFAALDHRKQLSTVGGGGPGSETPAEGESDETTRT